MSKATILGLCFILTFCGCSKPIAPPATTLNFWTIGLSPTYDGYLQGLVQQFEANHPGVHLNWTDMPQEATRQKLMASIAAGSPPDLVNLDSEFIRLLAESGALTNLSPYITPAQEALYFPNIWASGKRKDSTYAIPWYVTTRVIMMNNAILRQAGLSPNHPPRTWSDLDAAARLVTKKTKAIGLMPSIRILNDWAMNGVQVIDPTTLTPTFVTPQAVAAVNRYFELYQDGTMPAETLTEGYKGALDRYKAGRLAFLDAGPQFLLKIKADAPSIYAQTSLAPLPQTPSGTIPAAIMSFAIPVSSQHRQLAIDLALHLTSPSAQLDFAKRVPLLPSTIASTRDPYFHVGGGDPLLTKAMQISIQQLPQARDDSLALPRTKDLMRSLNNYVEQAIRGEISSQVALEQAAAAWQQTLAPFQHERTSP